MKKGEDTSQVSLSLSHTHTYTYTYTHKRIYIYIYIYRGHSGNMVKYYLRIWQSEVLFIVVPFQGNQ